jgi:hypothetical protein
LQQQQQHQGIVVRALPACLAAALGTRLEDWLPGPQGSRVGRRSDSGTLPRHLVTQMAADQGTSSALLKVRGFGRVQGT